MATRATRSALSSLLAAKPTRSRPLYSLLAAKPTRSCFCTTSGPDESRGYDVKEYDGLWRALMRDSSWPSDQKIAVVGPIGDDFLLAVEASCAAATGCSVLGLTTQPKTRWQSVRVMLRCGTADDFCALHSTLKGLDGTKAIV